MGMQTTLQTFIRSQPGYADAVVRGLAPMPGGASKQTWAFDLESGGAALPLVLRINRAFPLPMSLSPAHEFQVMQAMHAAGVPLPKPYWYSEDAFAGPASVLQRISGETLVRRLQRDDEYAPARAALPAELGRELARIHRAPIDGLEFLPARERGGSPALGELAFYEAIFREHAPEPHPALELALRWLQARAPQDRPRCLIHGDYRLGNVIFSPAGLTSILDWELAHLGDPAEDLAFISVQAWRFGQVRLPLGGIAGREGFFTAYAQAGGWPLDLQAVRYWEVMGNFKWAVIQILQSAPFLSGDSDSIELASLGRKTAETELQLLSLMEEV
jgi:aminoglycoside phosphotransferase (APT) family kinase protein